MRARPALPDRAAPPPPLAVARIATLTVTLALGVAAPRAAHAEGPYDGAWTMSPVSESFTVQSWSSACGPAPVSGTAVPGGPVTITSSSGELVISGARTLRTDACIDSLPTLARNVHSQDASSWRTRCATPTADPRHAVVNTAYFVSSGGDAITMAETGRYEFTINDARCVADVRRAGSIARVVAATAPAPSLAPTPAATASATAPTAAQPSPKADCSAPGAAAVLSVLPSRKLLKVGDTFAFHGAVLDAAGCSTGTAIQWTVLSLTFKDGEARAGAPTIDASGKLTVPVADFGDATFDVVATAGGRSAHARVEVALPADYDALLAESGLGASGELDAPAVAVLATSSIGAADAKAEDSARRRRLAFLGVIGGLVGVLGIVALVGTRRARKVKQAQAAAQERHGAKMQDFERDKQKREAAHAAQLKAHRESVAIAQQQSAAAAARGIDTGPVYCPSCRREYPAGTAFCAVDSNRLVAIRGHEQLMSGAAGGVCPVCHKGYNPGVKACPEHGEELVPASVASVASSGPAEGPAPAQRGKICPTCGARFDGASGFCGKDGTQLVLLN